MYGEWLEHYENELKADYEASFEERKKAIYEVLKRMRVYRENEAKGDKGSPVSGMDAVEMTKD